MSPEEEDGVKLVLLPLPADLAAAGGAAAPSPEEELAAAEARLPAGAVDELVGNGVSRRDAVAALTHSGGDISGAIEFHLTTLAEGGAAKALERQKHATVRRGSGPGGPPAKPEAERRLEEEARAVVQQFLSEIGTIAPAYQPPAYVPPPYYGRRGKRKGYAAYVATAPPPLPPQPQRPRVAVRAVERVQNWKLWTAYSLKREHILDEVQGSEAALNEHRVWHGTPNLDNIYSIIADGFKAQYSNMGGALGAGIYFAGAASYSHTYSSGQAPNAAAGLRGTSAPAWGMPGMVGLPYGAAPVAAAPPAAPPGHRWWGRHAMLLCHVTFGPIEMGRPGMRICNRGFHGVSNSGGNTVGRGPNDIYAVFDNNQAYPSYIVHYDV